jgi:sugar transferase (PEP-CTERM/EpsH1 system associated)
MTGMPVPSTSSAAPRLRLLQITHDLDLGGLQQVIYNLCRTLDRDRFEISVLCLREKGLFANDVEALGIPVYLLEQKQQGADYFAFRKVARLLRELRIDIVHTHNTQPFFDGTIGAMLAGVRTVVHTDHARAFPDKLRYMVAEWAMSLYAYRVVGCSEHTSQQLMRYEKIPKRKIVTIPNGIDGSRFELTIDRQAKRRELGIHEQGSVIGLAVRLSDQKGITFLLQAMPRILAKHPDTTLLIAGDGDLRMDLEQEAQQLGIAARVKFCGPRKDIPELLKLLDLYVLPSKWEGLPMVILEAMAAGCPIVATDVGGNSSAVVDGVTGALVPPQDPGVLADAIIRLLDSPDLLKTYAANGKNRFRERFSAETMARQYERLYLRRPLDET